jgi:hypothetical protein
LLGGEDIKDFSDVVVLVRRSEDYAVSSNRKEGGRKKTSGRRTLGPRE